MSKNEFQCPLPWRHLSIEPNGKVYTCCNAKPSDHIGSLKNSSLEEIRNGKALNEIREQFREGKIPSQCETCVFQERNGQVSLREASLREFPMDASEYEDTGKLSFFGLRFGNTCNMSCRICSSGLSTSWYSDDKSLGKQVPTGRVSSFSEVGLAELFKSIKESGECLYFAGGEPFLQPEFEQLIDFLLENKLTEIKLMINTNGSTFGGNPDVVLKRLRQFRNTYFELSLDDYQKRAEYARKGTDWNNIESNIEKIKEYNFDLYITPTISIFNILYLDEFLDYLLRNIKIKPQNIRMTVLREPTEYNISILPEKAKEIAVSKLTLYQKELLKNYDLLDVEGLINEINAVRNAMNNTSSMKIDNFIKKTKELDYIRGEVFSDVFPELLSLLEK